MLQEFKAFIMKGNVLELAVAVIIAAAFGAIVTSLTADIIMPVVGEVVGGVDFTELKFQLSPDQIGEDGAVVEGAAIRYGIFIQRIIDFIIIAFVIFHDYPDVQPHDCPQGCRAGTRPRAKRKGIVGRNSGCDHQAAPVNIPAIYRPSISRHATRCITGRVGG